MYYAKVSCADTFEYGFNPPNASPLRSHSARLCLSDRMQREQMAELQVEGGRGRKHSWGEEAKGKIGQCPSR